MICAKGLAAGLERMSKSILVAPVSQDTVASEYPLPESYSAVKDRLGQM